MTRNRQRKARIRARQQATGERYVRAARHVDDDRRRPIGELLERAAVGLCVADASDTDAVPRAAWAGVCTIGAAGQLLSACADPGHYRGRWLPAKPVLSGAVRALRATKALRGTSTEISPAGDPGDRLDDAAAAEICRLLAETADALGAALPGAAGYAQARAARRACRAGAATGLRVAGIYRAGKTRRPILAEAAAHPEWLQAHTPEEMQRVIDCHRDQLEAADPADTAAALAAAWYGFAVAFMLGQFLARRDGDYAVLHHNAMPVMARVVEILEAAPSMPAGIHGAGLDTTPTADQAMMAVARRGIWELTLAINALLPQVAELVGQEADRAVARAGTILAAELSDCYQARLRTFLNPPGRPPGSASLVIRSKGHSAEPRSRARDLKRRRSSGP